MEHRLRAQPVSWGHLLLGSILVAAYEAQVQCPQDHGSKTVVFTDKLNVGSTATFQCPSGEYASPKSSRTCQANGKWTINKISCLKIRCPPPRVFENGEFSPRGPFYVGYNITFTCNDGYIPRGSMERTCKKNGKWSGETAICDHGVGHCPDPGSPPGTIKTGDRYDVDDSVSYKCLPGLTLIGSSRRTCLESRRWSGTEAACHYPYTFDLPEEAGDYFAGSLSGILKTKKNSGSAGRAFRIKKDGILNVYIILDASSSVGEENFDLFKKCANLVVKKLAVYDMEVEFGIISFATESITVVSISDRLDADAVREEIAEKLDYSNHKEKSGTNTYAALEKVYAMMSSQKDRYKNPVVWNSIHHVIMLLTDGKSNMGGRPVQKIKTIRTFLNITDKREDYLDIYTFGVGEETDRTELNELASQKKDEKHVFILQSAEHMEETFQKITNITDYGEMCGLNDDDFPHPWNVMIETPRTSPCLGSLISARWVLSAAHCFTEVKTSYSFRIGEDKTEYKAEDIFLHDCYNLRRSSHTETTPNYDYDVALVRLSTDVKFSASARPICLPCTEAANRAMKQKNSASCADHRAFLLPGSDVPAEYLYRVEKNKDELKEVEVHIKKDNLRDRCISAIEGFAKKSNTSPHNIVSPRHLCVQGQMSCQGESGGSLFVNTRERARFFQVGVLSFGTFNPCELSRRIISGFPPHARDFYVDVLGVLPWIHKHLKGDMTFQPDTQDYKEGACPTRHHSQP